MKIVTGYAGEAHITSNDDQGLLQGIFGSGNYILPVRNRFAATLISSNELQISDGEGILQGVHFRVEPDTSDSVVIDNGSQGMQRIDLVCARYEKDPETGIETMSWINHKGTPAASNPATPSVTAGDLLAGDTLAEFPIYSIRLNGITVQSVTLLATILSPQALIGSTDISGIGDGSITGALSVLNSNLSGVKMFAMDVSSSRTFFVSDSYRGMLIITDSSLSRSGIYLVGVTGTGACSVKAVSIPDDTVITTGTNSLAINPTIGSRRILFITLAGTVS